MLRVVEAELREVDALLLERCVVGRAEVCALRVVVTLLERDAVGRAPADERVLTAAPDER